MFAEAILVATIILTNTVKLKTGQECLSKQTVKVESLPYVYEEEEKDKTLLSYKKPVSWTKLSNRGCEFVFLDKSVSEGRTEWFGNYKGCVMTPELIISFMPIDTALTKGIVLKSDITENYNREELEDMSTSFWKRNRTVSLRYTSTVTQSCTKEKKHVQ